MPSSRVTHDYRRTLVLATLLVAIALPVRSAVGAPAAGAMVTLEVPGGRSTLRLADIPDTVPRGVVLPLLVRMLHADPPGSTREQDERLARVRTRVEQLEAVRAAVAALNGRPLSLARQGDDQPVATVLRALGLERAKSGERRRVVDGEGPGPTAVRDALRDAGLDVAAAAASLNDGGVATIRVPSIGIASPLGEETASGSLVPRRIEVGEGFRALLLERAPALALHGVFAMSPETRAWLIAHPATFSRLASDPGPLCIYGRSLAIESNAVVLPGGSSEAPEWEALVGERTTHAERFITELFTRDEGRLAYFYDLVSRLTPEQRKATFARREGEDAGASALATYAAFAATVIPWQPSERPFAGPLFDGAFVLDELAVTRDGRPRGLRWQRFWRLALEHDDLPRDPQKTLRALERNGDADVRFLLEETTLPNVDDRRKRFEHVRYIQRVLPETPSSLAEALIVARGYARFPALLLALERLGIGDPSLLARAVRRAAETDGIGNDARRYTVLAQLQGALALIDGMARAKSLAATEVGRLVDALVAVPIENGAYHGRLASWFDDALLPTLALTAWDSTPSASKVPSPDPEGAVISAWSGPGDRPRTPLEWEGQRYVLDPAAAERQRLVAIRGIQGPSGLNDALVRWRAATAAGTGPQVDTLARVGMEVDRALARALLSLAYTRHLGDPETSVLDGDELSARHEFGKGATAWSRPVEDGNAQGRHLRGSLLGVDLALARLSFRRLSSDAVPPPRTVNENVLDLLRETVALSGRPSPSDEDLAQVGAAIAHGRERLTTAGTAIDGLASLADQADIGEWRRQALRWSASEEPERVADLFQPSELLRLGDGRVPDSLGTSASGIDGCWCRRVPRVRPWEDVAGRPGIPRVAAQLTDLGLQVAERLHELRLPASLYEPVLAIAAQDFVDRAAPLFPEDWPALARAASELTRERVEDFVSGLVGAGPLRIPEEPTR